MRVAKWSVLRWFAWVLICAGFCFAPPATHAHALTGSLPLNTAQPALGLAQASLLAMLWGLASALLILLPGAGLLAWGWPSTQKLDWLSFAGLASGLSIATYGIVLLISYAIGLQLGALNLWLPMLGGALLLAGHVRTLPLQRPKATLTTVLLFALVALILFTRAWAIRGLVVPMWGDSLHHSMIAQLLIENGGLFSSWQPYAPLTSFTYHFTFHGLVANFHWLTGLPTLSATLIIGQAVNLAAVIGVAALVRQAGGGAWAVAIAILVAGLLAPMPHYYTNWGRYTQLTGQILLPVAAVLYWQLCRGSIAAPRMILLTTLCVAGLALSHYRVAISGVLFIGCLFLYHWLAGSPNLRIPLLRRSLWVGLLTGLLLMPWVLNLFNSALADFAAAAVATPAAERPAAALQLDLIGALSTYLPVWLWLLFGIAGIMLSFRRPKLAALLGGWLVLTFLSANPGLVGLPGAGLIPNFAIFIAAYLPGALIIGLALAPGLAKLTRWQPIIAPLLALLLLGVGLWAVPQRIRDIQPRTHAMVFAADLQAAEWIQANLPADSKFVINAFPAFLDTVVVGGDAGWWLPLIAQRPVTVPPILYFSENGPTLEYRTQVNQLVFDLRALSVDHPTVLAQMQAQGVTHAYIGQLQGQHGGNPQPSLPLADLLASPHYHPVYQQGQVWVFAVCYADCPTSD